MLKPGALLPFSTEVISENRSRSDNLMEKRREEYKEGINTRCADAQTKFLLPGLLSF